MLLRIHHRLFVGFLGVVGVMVALVLLLVGRGLREDLKETFREELARLIGLAELTVDSSPGATPDSLARAITEQIGFRVSFISLDGILLGDSYVEPGQLPEVENHAGRPEVQGAMASGLHGDVTFAERTSATVGQALLYAARVVDVAGDPVILRIAAPLVDVDATVSRSRRAVTVAGVLAMVLALAAAWFMSRALSRPLESLAGWAATLAGGEVASEIPRGTNISELDELSLAFNHLTDELQARLSDLGRERDEMQALIDCMAEGVIAVTEDGRVLRTNRAVRDLLELDDVQDMAPLKSVVEDKTLRKLLKKSVSKPVEAREVRLDDRHFIATSRMLDQGGAVTTLLDITEIRRVEQVRRDFVANASHELKTPLTTVRGYAETLLEDEPEPDIRKNFAATIVRNAQRMQRLVDDLLDLSMLESGGWRLEVEEVEVAHAAEAAWEDLREAAEAKDVHFQIVGEGAAMADPHGLDQIFQNLLDNALRYTPQHSWITITIQEIEGMVEVSVADGGRGIPEESLDRVFERFYRVDPARDREMGGTGLGLSIVRHLVSVMEGDVWAESEPDQGAVIRFTLPVVEEPEGPDEETDGPDRI